MKISRKCAAMVLALPVAMIALQLAGLSKTILTELSTEKRISRPHHQQNEENYAPLISQFDRLTKNYANFTYNPPEDNEKELHYHDYAILIVMYHKTGFVLTRQLKNAVSLLEIETHRPDEKRVYYSKVKHTNYGTDKETGERFAFDTFGGW